MWSLGEGEKIDQQDLKCLPAISVKQIALEFSSNERTERNTAAQKCTGGLGMLLLPISNELIASSWCSDWHRGKACWMPRPLPQATCLHSSVLYAHTLLPRKAFLLLFPGPIKILCKWEINTICRMQASSLLFYSIPSATEDVLKSLELSPLSSFTLQS